MGRHKDLRTAYFEPIIPGMREVFWSCFDEVGLQEDAGRGGWIGGCAGPLAAPWQQVGNFDVKRRRCPARRLPGLRGEMGDGALEDDHFPTFEFL